MAGSETVHELPSVHPRWTFGAGGTLCETRSKFRRRPPTLWRPLPEGTDMIGDDGTSPAGGGYGARLEALGNLSSIGLGAAAGAPWWGVGALVLFYPVIRNLPSYVLTLVPGANRSGENAVKPTHCQSYIGIPSSPWLCRP